MHQCLLVAEIQGRIIDHLEPSDALRLALTSKSFLEQSLDCVWQDISSFRPLLACLPNDLWREERVDDEPSTILQLQRAVRPEDIHRYITYYAPRIRAFSPSIYPGMEIPSADALQALEMVTDRQPGALSPLLKEFVWYDAEDACNVLGDAFALQLSPRMHLFLGKHVEVLNASNGVFQDIDFVLHDTAIELSMRTSEARLKELTLCGSSHILECLKAFSWNRLERITLSSAPIAAIPRLASLPRLERLEVRTFILDPPGNSPSANPVRSGFRCLRNLDGYAWHMAGLRHLLQHLAGDATLQAFSWQVGGRDILLEDLQSVLDVISERCAPLNLTSLNLLQYGQIPKEEPFDVRLPDQLDISSLFKFQNLTVIRLSVMHNIFITPEIIARIPTSWPRLQQLVLSPSLLTTHTISITHKHILQLSLALPSLAELGIQFDATGVTEQVEIREAEFRSKLRVLYVGLTPTRV